MDLAITALKAVAVFLALLAAIWLALFVASTFWSIPFTIILVVIVIWVLVRTA